ncbi:MAG: pilin [Lachnospiraceae bacterium]|nr:pilin [Lachnospiraceae bacterium]
MKRRTKVMKKNQGFSLVELIVVIAIMAVLVGVLAPAYLRYVEKSRKSTDISSISDILAAAEKVAIDPQFDLGANSKFILSGQGTLNLTTTEVTSDGDSAALAEWKSIAGSQYVCKSKEFKTLNVTFTGTLQANGSVTWTQSGAADMLSFSPDFQKKWNFGAAAASAGSSD